MNDNLEYIENFFLGELSEEESQAFEIKCENDPAFAKEVSLYIAMREGLKRELHEQKKKEFDNMYAQLSKRPSTHQPLMRKLVPYLTAAAAACLLIFFAWFFYWQAPSPRQLADNYIEENLQTLSVTMNGTKDSLQIGIAAFNREDYAKAEEIFQSLARQKDEVAPEALKYLGITYLVTGQYDKALAQFDTLSAYPNLYVNPGPLYKAITLMKRDAGNDREEARKILGEIIREQLSGSEEAEEWIQHF